MRDTPGKERGLGRRISGGGRKGKREVGEEIKIKSSETEEVEEKDEREESEGGERGRESKSHHYRRLKGDRY